MTEVCKKKKNLKRICRHVCWLLLLFPIPFLPVTSSVFLHAIIQIIGAIVEPKVQAFRQRVFGGGADGEILQNAFNVDMTRAKMKCLRTQVWLNDEVRVIKLEMCSTYMIWNIGIPESSLALERPHHQGDNEVSVYCLLYIHINIFIFKAIAKRVRNE